MAWVPGSTRSKHGSGRIGADGWAMTPSGTRGVLIDALSIYFGDPTLASAFVARWCAGYQVETSGGVLQVRGDDPTPWIGATFHRTPRAWQRISIGELLISPEHIQKARIPIDARRWQTTDGVDRHETFDEIDEAEKYVVQGLSGVCWVAESRSRSK